jgi:hypothetical protein
MERMLELPQLVLPLTLVILFFYNLHASRHSLCMMRKGSSLFALPTAEADILNKKIGAKKNWSGQYIVDCNAIPDLPAMSISFGGKPFVLTAEDYVLQVQTGGSAAQCVSGFMGLDVRTLAKKPLSRAYLWCRFPLLWDPYGSLVMFSSAVTTPFTTL